MNLDEDEETHQMIKDFKMRIQNGINIAKSKGQEPDYYKILRNSLLALFKKDILFSVVHAFISESLAVFYSYYIIDMIKYIKNPESSLADGAKVVGLFIFAQLMAQVLRNRYVLYGF